VDSNPIFSPSGEPQPNVLSSIPVRIQFKPALHEVGAREIDLVLSILDDIVQEMQRLDAEVQSDAGVV